MIYDILYTIGFTVIGLALFCIYLKAMKHVMK